MDLLIEEFPDPEEQQEADVKPAEDAEEQSEEGEVTVLELPELLENADIKIANLQQELIRAKSELDGLNDAEVALKNTQKSEISIIEENFNGSKAELRVYLSPIKDQHKEALRTLKVENRAKTKELKSLIKNLERDIPLAVYEKNILTLKGKLQIVLGDDDMLQKLSDRFVAAEVSKKLDYPIFMAVSEYGGKNNSGEYEYLVDEEGNIVEDDNGNPHFKQDLVNYSITKEELANIAEIDENKLCIAEAFIKFAKDEKLNFWN